MSKEVKLPSIIEKFIEATNGHNGETFINCFAEDAFVNDAARNFWGREQIKKMERQGDDRRQSDHEAGYDC